MSIITTLASTAAQVEELSGGAVVDRYESGSLPLVIGATVFGLALLIGVILFFTVDDNSDGRFVILATVVLAPLLSMFGFLATYFLSGKEAAAVRWLDADSLALLQSDLALNGITVGDKTLANAITEEATSVTVVRDGEIEHMSLFVLKGEDDYTVTWNLAPQSEQAEQAEG